MVVTVAKDNRWRAQTIDSVQLEEEEEEEEEEDLLVRR